jgi:hypothetical protein
MMTALWIGAGIVCGVLACIVLMQIAFYVAWCLEESELDKDNSDENK